MEQPLLSILIPTVVGREAEVLILKSTIQSQLDSFSGGNEAVEVIEIKDDKSMTIGEKRELLYQKAKGLYSWQIDDDDSIDENAIVLILDAIGETPNIPCITFKEKCLMNGVHKVANHSIKYAKWADNQDGYDYARSPFYKDVIRTDIAQKVPFPKIRWNEDEQWSYAILPLLTEENHIEKEIYHYIYEPKDSPNERYGLNK
jgi:hypothetical protein